MKLGAQFYSLRERCKTPEDLYTSFAKIKEIGYDVVQMSGICQIEAEKLKAYSEEFSLPITCTHTNPYRILNETDAVIKEHNIFGCPVIGIGCMPNKYHGSIEGIRQFIKDFTPALDRITDAGLTLTYHNHHFEFDDIGGTHAYNILLEEAPKLNFILDTYWLKYANQDILEYIKLLAGTRMTNIHFKDMKTEPQGAICPCGAGTIDFAPIVKVCRDLKLPYALVEQDNAPELGDEFEQMKESYNNLKHLF